MISLLHAIAVSFFIVSAFSNDREPTKPVTTAVPASAVLEIEISSAPGMKDRDSKLELSYDLRITDEASFFDALHQGRLKAGQEEDVGDQVQHASFVRTLPLIKNGIIEFRIPLDRQVRERLRRQPESRVKLTAANATRENVRLSKEQEKAASVFLFRSNLRIYDARLKRNLIIPVSRHWMFEDYPQARFRIIIEIDDQGGYKVSTPLPYSERSGQVRIP